MCVCVCVCVCVCMCVCVCVCVCVYVCVCVQVTSYLLLLGFYALPNKKIYIPLQFWAGDDS